MFEGESKPKVIDEFMIPLVTELNFLIMNGLEDVVIKTGNLIVDSPARSLILDTKQAPGYYCCNECHIKGEHVPHFNTRSFNGTGHRKRTHEEFITKAQFDIHNKKESHHVSGFSVALERLTTIDIVKNSPVDYMHCTCLGCMKRLMEIWIKTLPGFKEYVDQYILKIQKCWPIEFQRMIRPIKFLDHFKASEFRVWLLYVAPAVMLHFMPHEQYLHFCLLHHGLRLLFMSSSPSKENIDLSQKCINQFLNQWHTFYPQSALSYVVHATEHLPENCQEHKTTPDGFSAFPFESYLRRVKRNYHSGGKHLEQVS